MSKILVKEKGANMIETETKFIEASNEMEVNYLKDTDSFHFMIDIGKDDDYISFDINADNFMHLIKESLVYPETE